MSDNDTKPEGEVIPIRPGVKEEVAPPVSQGPGYTMYRKASDLVWRYRVALGWATGGFLAGWLVFRGKK